MDIRKIVLISSWMILASSPSKSNDDCQNQINSFNKARQDYLKSLSLFVAMNQVNPSIERPKVGFEISTTLPKVESSYVDVLLRLATVDSAKLTEATKFVEKRQTFGRVPKYTCNKTSCSVEWSSVEASVPRAVVDPVLGRSAIQIGTSNAAFLDVKAIPETVTYQFAVPLSWEAEGEEQQLSRFTEGMIAIGKQHNSTLEAEAKKVVECVLSEGMKTEQKFGLEIDGAQGSVWSAVSTLGMYYGVSTDDATAVEVLASASDQNQASLDALRQTRDTLEAGLTKVTDSVSPSATLKIVNG